MDRVGGREQDRSGKEIQDRGEDDWVMLIYRPTGKKRQRYVRWPSALFVTSIYNVGWLTGAIVGIGSGEAVPRVVDEAAKTNIRCAHSATAKDIVTGCDWSLCSHIQKAQLHERL